MTENLKFLKPEPIEFKQDLLKKYKIEWETDEHIRWKVEKQHYDNFNSVSKETRQDIINTFNTGITIGEVGERLGIDSKIVADVIYLNIAQASYLRSETL